MKSQNIELDDFDQLTRLLTDDLKETSRSALRVLTDIRVDRALRDYVDEFVFDQVKRDPYVGIENLEIVRRKTRRILNLTEVLSRAASTPDDRAIAYATLRLLAAITSLESIGVEVCSLNVNVMEYALKHALDVRFDYREISGHQFSMVHALVNNISQGPALVTIPAILQEYISQQQIPVTAAIRQIVKRALMKGGDDEIC